MRTPTIKLRWNSIVQYLT